MCAASPGVIPDRGMTRRGRLSYRRRVSGSFTLYDRSDYGGRSFTFRLGDHPENGISTLDGFRLRRAASSVSWVLPKHILVAFTSTAMGPDEHSRSARVPDRSDASPMSALYAFTIQMRQQARRDLPLAAQRVSVLSIPGPEPLSISPLDFGRARPLIASAYEVASDFLDRVRVDGAGLYAGSDT